uniref:Uncharacterized protein n=1 Tax=Plectus sambesii TaxID=2011161 RepID=A0A914UJ29_9BILA
MNVLLKRFLPLNQVDHFPLLAAISQELDKATLHNDIDNIAGRTRSRSKPTRSAPVERLALGDSRFGFNLFGRMQAAQSLPYKLNKTAAQRIIYQPFYQPKEQGYESGVRMGNSRRLSNDRAYNSQQQQRVMHIKDEQCQVHPEELDDGVNVARPKPIAVQTDDSRMAAAGTQTDYVPRRHSTVVVRRKHDRTLSRGSNARASADHRPRQNSTFLGDMRRSSSAMSALASSQARNAARQRVSLSQSRRQYHGVVTPPPPPPPPLPSVRPGSVARDRRKESLGRRLSSAAISPITAAYSSDFADDSNASADTAARELSVIVSSESQAESESDTTSSVPEEAIPKSSSASSVSTEKAPSSVRSVGTVIEKRKSSSSESSVASEVIERELKKMERASVEQRTQRPLSPTSAYLAKLRAERSRIAPVVKPVSPVNTDSVSSYQPSDVDFLSPRF